jgi:hypothetical protein
MQLIENRSSVADVVQKVKVSDAKAGLDSVCSHLSRQTVDGAVYWMAHDLPGLSDASRAADLLPGFDAARLDRSQRHAETGARPENCPWRKRHVSADHRHRWPRSGHMETHLEEKE